jgi:hypothetical protein
MSDRLFHQLSKSSSRKVLDYEDINRFLMVVHNHFLDQVRQKSILLSSQVEVPVGPPVLSITTLQLLISIIRTLLSNRGESELRAANSLPETSLKHQT